MKIDLTNYYKKQDERHKAKIEMLKRQILDMEKKELYKSYDVNEYLKQQKEKCSSYKEITTKDVNNLFDQMIEDIDNILERK